MSEMKDYETIEIITLLRILIGLMAFIAVAIGVIADAVT